ncbi:MAG TPA: 2-phospho-L-lactate guanylyltransferase [Acidimicrobiia bacterium]|nr:2-phospho-L-lactate guanylyltransferase [Acidimicrobiia bacterium]
MPPERRRSRDPHASEGVGVVVPIRSFLFGKARLAGSMPDSERVELARHMATAVLDATEGARTAIVSSDDDVVVWARERHVTVLDDPGSLDGAADVGRRWAAGADLARVVLVHADLPLIRSLDPVLTPTALPSVTIVPCHRGDGTPVLALPSSVPFRFAYGPGSFRRHCDEARRLGLGLRVVEEPTLRFDVDVLEDLAELHMHTPRGS